jgi:catechol 2,3-dioxygenase-like lactoylglutathione lyase family enzyme
MKTHGLTHVALAVKDVQRSLAFYSRVLGVVPVYQEQDSIQAQTPGTHNVLVFERDPKRAGRRGSVAHFGFRLVRPVPVSTIVARVKKAGGKVLSKGECAPGLPYVFFEDPDGYEVEVWYEARTPVDPKPARVRWRRTAAPKAPGPGGPGALPPSFTLPPAPAVAALSPSATG